MSRSTITTKFTQVTILEKKPQIIIPQNMEMLANFYEKITKNFLDVLILKKLNERQMRLCELLRALKKEEFLSVDSKTLYKRIRDMKKEEVIQTRNIEGRKFYGLTDKGKKIIEIIQKQRCQINEIIQKVI